MKMATACMEKDANSSIVFMIEIQSYAIHKVFVKVQDLPKKEMSKLAYKLELNVYGLTLLPEMDVELQKHQDSKYLRIFIIKKAIIDSMMKKIVK